MNADDQINPHVSDGDVLDWALGRLDGPQVEHVEQALADSPALREKTDAVHRILALLDKHKVADADEELAEQIRQRVAAIRMAPVEEEEPRRAARPSIFSFAEIGAAAAALMLLALVFVPGAIRAHETRQRLACESNMRQIGVALEHYANSHEQRLPMPRIPADGNWLNRDRGRRATGTAPLFILVSSGWVRPEDVTCPAAQDRAFAGDPAGLSDFPDAVQCSYSFQNLFGADKPERVPQAALLDKARPRPILADRNPLFRTGQFCQDASYNSNSYNHGRNGQNILFTDGRVRWTSSPQVEGDNIWLSGSTRQYHGTETSASTGDWFFAP